jgi:uncharacterized protein
VSGGEAGFDWAELAMFFFVGVPLVGAVLTGVFGRKFGGLLTGGVAGTVGWWFSASLLIAGLAAAVALFLVGVLGVGARGGPSSRGRGGSPVIWGDGGSWGGGGGGFSSGGGGGFGGGGASGDW